MSRDDKALAILVVSITGVLAAMITPWALVLTCISTCVIALSKSKEA